MSSIYIIISGFVIEALFIKFCAKQKWIKSFFISAIMNGASAVFGSIFIAVGGYFVTAISILLKSDTDTLIWIISYIFAVCINVLIEGLVLHMSFWIDFKKSLWWLITANLISVVMSLFISVSP